ncbi:hypothetical protein KIPB_002916, partial [Kipferlia bialata]
ASDDKAILIWNLEPSLRAFRFLGHSKKAVSVSFSPTSDLVASASFDNTIRLWTPTVRGDSIYRRGHTSPIRQVAFSEQGDELVTASDDKTAKVWDVEGLKFKYTLTGHTNWVRAASFCPDGRLIATASDDSTIRVWDTRTHETVSTIGLGQGLVLDAASVISCVCWSPDGTLLAAGVGDRVQIWDTRTLLLSQHYECHSGCVNALAWHPRGRALISVSDDGTARVLDTLMGRTAYTIKAHSGPVKGVACAPDGTGFVTGGADGKVLMWSMDGEGHRETPVPKSRASERDGVREVTRVSTTIMESKEREGERERERETAPERETPKPAQPMSSTAPLSVAVSGRAVGGERPQPVETAAHQEGLNADLTRTLGDIARQLEALTHMQGSFGQRLEGVEARLGVLEGRSQRKKREQRK